MNSEAQLRGATYLFISPLFTLIHISRGDNQCFVSRRALYKFSPFLPNMLTGCYDHV